tara:strand:+ start:187 stop:720 length:534 start_codon:yes stop_codon:yes gene_type:complete
MTNPVLSVTVFEGTSLERTLTVPIDIDTSKRDSLQIAVADCLLQAQAIEEAAGVELHIAALEKAQGKKLTKAQRELVTMSYNIYNGGEVNEQSKPEETKKETPVEEPTNETSNEASSSEGTDTSTESSGVEEDPEPEPTPEPEVSEDPIADAVEEIAQEEGTNVDEDLQSALDALGI